MINHLSLKKVANDIVWILRSPTLIPLPSSVLEPVFQQLSEKDIHTLASVTLSQLPKKMRLGKYFEMLCQGLLSRGGQREIIFQNQQIIEDKKTIGEFDLVVLNKMSGKFEHWELAIKFYLKVGAFYVGTNIRDRLDIKSEKLLNKQIKLAEHPTASQWLRDRGIVIEERRILSRGKLFVEMTSNEHHNVLTTKENYWVVETLFLERFGKDVNWRWRVLTKLEWMCTNPDHPKEFVSAKFLVSSLKAENYGAVYLVGQLKGVEAARLMLVTENWLVAAHDSLPCVKEN